MAEMARVEWAGEPAAAHEVPLHDHQGHRDRDHMAGSRHLPAGADGEDVFCIRGRGIQHPVAPAHQDQPALLTVPIPARFTQVAPSR